MNDCTDLIADAREWPRDGVNEGPLINALADAVEALMKKRDELKREMHARELHHFEEEQRSVGFAAQLAKLSRLVRDGAPHWVLCRHISATPADALREHDAALIESLADDRGVDASEDHDDEWWVGYRQAQREIIHWLTERARQVREGEA